MKQKAVGLIAGEGDLPVEVFKACLDKNIHVETLKASSSNNYKLKDETAFEIDFDDIYSAIQYLKNKQIKNLVFAGRVDNKHLFKNLNQFKQNTSQLTPFGDDSYYQTIIKLVEGYGFCVHSLLDILNTSLADSNSMTQTSPSADALKDIDIGFSTIKSIGCLDIGQALIIDNGYVVGVEAMEGTDGLIRRCRELKSPNKSGVLIKVKKTSQDTRIDLPVIGKQTIIHAYQSNLSGIAVESGCTILINKKEVLNTANQLNIFVTGISTS